LSQQNTTPTKTFLTFGIAVVWLINGLFCKMLNFVPRHQQIVARIIGEGSAFVATKIIGVLEILMFVWILSNIKPRWCALVQILLIAVMNIIEFILVPDMLLFGRVNALMAVFLICIIFINELVLAIPLHKKAS
jgi:hypothetical protein